MQRQKILNLITNLESFLGTIQSINNHPYSTGVDVEKLINDLQDYLKDMKAEVELIEELMPDTAEPEPIKVFIEISSLRKATTTPRYPGKFPGRLN